MAGTGKKFVKAAWDYTANEDEELTFKVGDIIEVTAEDPSGWWTGTVNGNSGTFPNNFVEPYTPPAKKKAPPPVAPRPSARAAAAPSESAAPSPAAASPAGPSRAAPPAAAGGSDPMAELRAKLAKRSTMAPAEGSAAPSGPSRKVPSARTPGRATMAPAASGDAPASPFGPGMLKRAGTRTPAKSGSDAPAESPARPLGRSNTVSTGAAPGNVAKLKGMAIPLGGAPPVGARGGRPAPSGGAPSPAARPPAPAPRDSAAAPSTTRKSVVPAPRGTAAAGVRAPAPAPAPRAGGRPAPAPAPAPAAVAPPPPIVEEEPPSKKARGTFAYTAEGDGELSFAEGDVITIIEQDESGWWQGELNGQVGWFPASFAEEMEEEPKGPTIEERLAEATSDVKLLQTTKRIGRTGRRPPTRRKKAGAAVKSMKTETSDAPADLTGRETVINIGGALAAQLKAAGAAAKKGGPSGPTIPTGPQPEVTAAAFPKLRKSGASPSGPTRAPKAEGEPTDFRKNLRRTAAPRIQGAAAASDAPSTPAWAKKSSDSSEGMAKLTPGGAPKRAPSPQPEAEAFAKPSRADTPAVKKDAPKAAAPAAAAAAAPGLAKIAPARGRGRPSQRGGAARPSASASAAPEKGAQPSPAAAPAVEKPSLPAKLGDYDQFVAAVASLYKAAKAQRGGKVSSHPVHSKAGAATFGVSVCTVDGVVHSLGAADKGFSLASACHPLLYALSLHNDSGKTSSLVGNQAAGDNIFDLPRNKAPNPLVTAGAIALASQVGSGSAAHERSGLLFEAFTKMAGAAVGCNMATFLAGTSDQAAATAQAHWMESKELIGDGAQALSLYQQAYSGLVTCETLATMAATLANGGTCPKNNQEAVSSDAATKATSMMKSCSMGTKSQALPLPGHGSDSGGLLVVVPGVCGLAVYSPPLNDEGISTRGVEFTKAFQAKFGL